jgi:anti-sigma factor RsiW
VRSGNRALCLPRPHYYLTVSSIHRSDSRRRRGTVSLLVRPRGLVEAYLDEELDPGLMATVEEHLSECPICSEAHSRLSEQKASIRSVAPYYTASAQLEQSVHDALRRSTTKEMGTTGHSVPWRWFAIAASILLVISFSWNIRPSQRRPAEDDPVAQNLLFNHIRSLIGTHLLDVTSSDRHTVKPWFNGKLDFSPEVKDFASQGFALIGGRLDYSTDRTVAALVYRRRQHVINVFTWPSDPSPVIERPFSRNGYNVVHWTHGAMTYWAVSDITIAELEQFKDLNEK